MTRRDRTDAADRPRARDPEQPPGSATPDGGAAPSSSDPRRIRTVAVTESDVVDALEATARGDREIVLRITPPFSGRMRARLHDAGAVEPDGDPGPDADGAADGAGTGADVAAPVHVRPERFVADPPAFPTVDDTEDELRASETPYTRERHRERHQRAVEEWRATVRERLAGEVTLDTDEGSTTVSVAYLG